MGYFIIYIFSDLKRLSNLCRRLKIFFKDNQYIEAEYLVLRRIIYRMKQKFRSSKDFKATEQVCKSLKIYFNTDIVSHLKTIIGLIPKKYKKKTYLPSKNLIVFLLVRLQGISCLLKKIVESCLEAAGLLFIRLKTGHLWKVGIIVYSIISRIYALMKFATNKICEFYNKLIIYSRKLKGGGKWLPDVNELPLDLKEWLNIDWLELDEEIQLVDITEIPSTSFFNLVDDDDDIEFCDEYILVKDEEKREIKSELITDLRGFEINDDIGDIVELEDSIIDCNLSKDQVDSKEVVELSDDSFETDENLPKFKSRKQQKLNKSLKKQKNKNGIKKNKGKKNKSNKGKIKIPKEKFKDKSYFLRKKNESCL